ncbi:Cytochrome bd-I ubiquinol oxidase subunit 1 [bioreactor metagenome]|uniref:Cytochrome bd-I ubiquinol oxidase subunit 1 n=1 Tax=bioreactor metagenome TaxID=1076179 RepID=A0A645GII5_9ZZZZ
MQTIRKARTDAEIPAEARLRFENNGANLGYALLLMRYVDDPRKATEAQIHQAAMDTVPPVGPLFWTFRIMVALGMFFIVLTGTFFWLAARHRLDAYPWLPKVAVFSIPLPWIAAECGWVVAELGRQPWIIEGVLPTAMAVSNLGAKTLLLTIAGFVLIYTVLLVIELKLMVKAIKKGPEHESEPHLSLYEPMIKKLARGQS